MSKHGDIQFAALPWRIGENGRREIMLLTSRETRRWVIPDDLLAHVAPLGWEHIALTGDYVWANGNAAPDFRPLRDVPAAFMARAA